MGDGIFLLWFLVTASDAIGGSLAAWRLWRSRRHGSRTSFYLAFLLVGVVIEAIFAGGSLIMFWPDEYHVAPAFATARIIGRTIKSVGVWLLALYLLGILNGVEKTDVPK